MLDVGFSDVCIVWGVGDGWFLCVFFRNLDFWFGVYGKGEGVCWLIGCFD